MGIVQSVPENIITAYGTTQIQEFGFVDFIPEQILGLIQCRPDEETCNEICLPITVLDGDENSFLFKFASDDNSGGVIDDYRLEKLNDGTWEEVVTGNFENTLGIESGEKFTFGSFPDYALYSGFRVDWGKVFDAFLSGTYRFVVHNIFDGQPDCYTPPFNLIARTCANLDDSFYIEMTNTGSVRNWRFTNSGSNTTRVYDLINSFWKDSSRYFGRFDSDEIEVEESFMLYGDQNNQIVGSEDQQGYNMKLFTTTFEYKNRLFSYGLAGQDIRVTDTNSDSEYNFSDVPVVRDGSIDATKPVNNSLLYNVNIKMRNQYNHGMGLC